MDKKMLMVFYGYARKNKTFGKFMCFIYGYSSLAFFIIFHLGSIYLLLNDLQKLPYYLITPLCGLVLNFGLRKLFRRKRPYLKLNLIPPKDKLKNKQAGKDSYSFPSNHSISAGSIAFACMYVNSNVGTAVFFMAIMTGLSRLFTAVHYPSDVIAGLILSGLLAIIGFNLLPVVIGSIGISY